MADRTARFERKPAKSEADLEPLGAEEVEKFSPAEEASLLQESNDHKAEANAQFAKGQYSEAIDVYNQALNSCPKYLHYERAVLKSNVAACYIKLEEWKDAEKAASESIKCLDSLDPSKKVMSARNGDEEQSVTEAAGEEELADEEVVSPGAAKAEDTSAKAKRTSEIERIISKALLRRAKARSEIGGWSSLQGAEEDYKELSQIQSLTPSDRRLVQQQLRLLPPRTKAAQEKEMGEMMGKLKQLGNGILKPFGLSTDNFQMVKDEKTGGYSMNFNQGTG